MINLRKSYSMLSFKMKLFLSYTILILIPITVGGILINNNFFVLFRDKSSMLITQRMDEEILNIDRDLANIEMIGYQITSNAYLSTFLRDKYTEYDYDFFNNLSTRIYPMFSWIKSTNPNISNAYLFTYNKTLPNAYLFKHAQNYENQDWFKSVKKNTLFGSPYWEAYHPERDYTGANDALIPSGYPSYSLFYTINPINNMDTAYLELVINPRLLFDTVTNASFGKKGYFAVMNADGSVISGKSTPLLSALSLDKGFQLNFIKHLSHYRFIWDSIPYDISFHKIDRLDAYLLSIVPVTEITELFEKPKQNYIVSIFITAILLLILAYYIDIMFTKKVNKISDAIYKFQEGDFHTAITVKGMDELDKLSMDFNSMSHKINELVNTVYKAEIAQKQDQIFALQAQINPHFIYNTLESLKMMAELHDEENISDGLTALGNLLRQNNTIGKHLISIESELENLSDYIKIQNLTYNNRIKIDFDVSEEIMEYKILSLVLQPLVENSIIHGLDESGNFIEICITGMKKEREIIFTVRDNGKGIDSSKLSNLNIILNNEDPDKEYKPVKNGIGLFNVNRRIKLYFGDNYGLRIESIVNTGTTITVIIPVTL